MVLTILLPHCYPKYNTMPKKAFTAAFIQAVKVEKRTEFFDEITSGLGLRVSPSGNKTFFYRYRHNNKIRRYKIGKFSSVMTLAKARKRADELRLEVKSGGDPQGKEQSIKSQSPRTFGELVIQYKAIHLPTLKESTQNDYENRLNIILKHFKKDRYLKDISRGDVFNFLESIKAPVQAQRIQAILSGVLNFAFNREWIEYNPATKIQLSSKKAKRDKPRKNIEFSEKQILKLWSAFDNYSKVTGSLFKLLLILGQRLSETRKMKWDELDLKNNVWFIPGSNTKNGKDHYVPLSELALEILDEMKTINGGRTFVFESPQIKNRPIGKSQKAAQRIRERTRVDDFNIHSLRTTSLTKMASLGVSQQVLSKVFNHTTDGEGSRITAIYNQYDYEKEKREAINRWNNHLYRILNSKEESNILKLSS